MQFYNAIVVDVYISWYKSKTPFLKTLLPQLGSHYLHMFTILLLILFVFLLLLPKVKRERERLYQRLWTLDHMF